MNIIIIGASDGIGKALAQVFAQNQHNIAITARRQQLLAQIKENLLNPNLCTIKDFDICNYDTATQEITQLIEAMGGVDIVVINAGIGNSNFEWQGEQQIIQTNVLAFVNIAHFMFEYFAKNPQKQGQIVGISSIAAVKNVNPAPAYAATKAFISSYMDGLRYRANKLKINNIHITDIRPGYVLTPMTENQQGMFWVATPQKAAQQIYDAIIQKKQVAYITKRWKIIAIVLKFFPFLVTKIKKK